MSSYNVTIKIHVWIGKTTQSREEFSRYFEINEADRDQGIGASQFDKDLQIKWYDDDLIGVFYNDEDDSLETAIDEIPTSPQAIEQVQARCEELGITEANAMFYYEDAELTVPDPDRSYNELTYLGSFDNT
jgi:Immunity protein 22